MPPKVSGLKANVSTIAALSWKPSKGAHGYCVYYNIGKGWHEYGETTATSCKRELPADVTQYTFGVKPYRMIGGKRYISTDLTVVKCVVPARPKAVTGFTLKSAGAASLALKWTKVKNADGYVVYQKSGTGYKRIAKNNYNGAYTVKGLKPNTSYTFAIRSYRTVKGREVLSMNCTLLSAVTMPAKVKDLAVTLSEERAYLTWTASKGADGYMIYHNDGSGWKEYGTAKIPAFRKRQLVSSTDYTFGVKTYRMIRGKRVISSDITTVKGCTAPLVPNYTFTKRNNVYTLKWSAVKGADEYIVYSQIPGQSWVRRAVTKGLTASFTQQGTPQLYLAVRAVNIHGSEKILSEIWKKLASDTKPSGSVYTFGDSISKGTGSHLYTYAEIFAERHNLEVYRRTISGTSLCSALDSRHICEEVLSCIRPGSDYSYIMIEGGRNDYFYNCPIGVVTPNGTKKFDMNTVCGALEAAFSHIKTNSPNSRVIFVMMHDAANQSKIKNSGGLTFVDYADAICAVCAKYGVQVADCLNAGLNTGDQAICSKYTH